jgi:death on curing protein
LDFPVRYLTPQEVLFIHARLIAETGGEHGLRDVGLLASAVARPQATFDGRDLYPDLFTKAAALMSSLLLNHPFLDGNKRTGITATALFLRQNDRMLHPSNEALEAFTLRVVNERLSVAEIARWLEQNSHNL